MSNSKLEALFSKLTQHPHVHEALLWIQDDSGGTVFLGMHERTLDTPMLLASVTKLWTTACILKLIDQGRLSLHDPLSQHLESTWLSYAWVQPTSTIAQLLTHLTGYPDYYLASKTHVFNSVRQQDFGFTRDDEFVWTETLKPKTNQAKQKAYYADINFTLLGLVLEAIHQKPLFEVYDEVIVKPLNLTQSYLATGDDAVPATYDGANRFDRPLFIKSCYASGGVVSTAKELMVFIRAFFSGQLFDPSHLDMTGKTLPLQWTFYPIRYGLGHMEIPVKMPFKAPLSLRGHAGSTGAFAYYCPQTKRFIVGDIPQINKPSRPVRLAMRAATYHD